MTPYPPCQKDIEMAYHIDWSRPSWEDSLRILWDRRNPLYSDVLDWNWLSNNYYNSWYLPFIFSST